MYENDYPVSLYEENFLFTVEDFDDPERFTAPEKQKEKNYLKRFLALLARE